MLPGHARSTPTSQVALPFSAAPDCSWENRLWRLWAQKTDLSVSLALCGRPSTLRTLRGCLTRTLDWSTKTRTPWWMTSD
jgi:hypothetical protein